MKILNLGCGDDDYGTHRVDMKKTKTSTHLCNIEKEKLPFENDFFDKIYCRNFFEHLSNPNLVLEEMKRVCKRGGEIEIITDNAEYIPHNRGEVGFKHGDCSCGENDHHYGIYTIEHMQNHLNKAGLRIEKVWVDNFDKEKRTLKSTIFMWIINTFTNLRCLPKLKAIAIKK